MDNKRRIRIPDLKPGEVLAYQNNGNDSFTLTKVKAVAKEPFPEGSLAYLCTPERDAELTAIAKGCVVGIPKNFDSK